MPYLHRATACRTAREMCRTSGTTLRSSSMSSLVKRIWTPALLPPACCEVRPGKTPTAVAPKLSKDVLDGTAETIAVGQQQHDRRDAPGHAQHGEQRLAQIVPHGAVGLLEQIAVHVYSLRSASTGCSSAALRAG